MTCSSDSCGEGRPAPRALPWQRDAHNAATTVEQRIACIRCDAARQAMSLLHLGHPERRSDAAWLLRDATLRQARLCGLGDDPAYAALLACQAVGA